MRQDLYNAGRALPLAGLVLLLGLTGGCAGSEQTARPAADTAAAQRPLEVFPAETPVGFGRLLDGELSSLFGKPPEVASVQCDGQRRQAAMIPVPAAFAARGRIPRNGRLLLGLNHYGLTGSVSGLHFRVRLGDEGPVLLDSAVNAFETGWQDRVLDLSAFSGEEHTLRFEVSFETSGELPVPENPVLALWSELLLVGDEEPEPRPNLLFVLIDTLRPDHLGCYGYSRPTSPNLDKLAAGGVRFDRVVSTAPWTDPSILTLMTGLLPSDVWEARPHKEAVRQVLPRDVETLAEILRANGYFTLAASDHPGINANRFGAGFDIFAQLHHVDGPYTRWRKTAARKVLLQVRELLEASPERGLFAYVHVLYPHQPYGAPEPYRDMFGPGTDEIEERNRDRIVNRYDGEIRLTDDFVAALLREMERLGLGRDLITVVTSDHGEGFWEHGFWEHGNTLYNELLRVPLILHAPGRLPAGRVHDGLVSLLDVPPTLLDLVGVDDHGMRGRSLLPLLRGDRPAEDGTAFSEFPHSKIVDGRAIQSPRWKLIRPQPDSPDLELFDLDADPLETRNVHGSFPEVTSKLGDAIDWTSRSAAENRSRLAAEEAEPSEEMLEKLRSLGYVE